ncbi:MAG: CarD family transcriptional regulator [Lachnospiraceae bacterium]|nr:CarD family transcriptional regulator [Lachnospiraceae bacterium]
MFQTGDYVVKIGDGLCRIVDVTDMAFGNKVNTYYQLEAVSGHGAKIYVPADKADDRMRQAMTREDALKLIQEIPGLEPISVVNEKLREQQYQDALQSCDPRQLAQMIITMYLRKQKRFTEGKKSISMDDRYFKTAEDCLYSELAHALEEDRDAVLRRIEAAAKSAGR